MTAVQEEPPPTPVEPIPFRDSRWHTIWLALGLAAMLLFRCAAAFDWSWMARTSPLLWLLAFMIGPQLFLLMFPLLTRQPGGIAGVRWPNMWRWPLEFLIACGVVVLTLVALWVAEIILVNLWPGTSLSAKAYTDMAQSPNVVGVLGMLLFSFTIVPLAEEMFFRGFLHNALRARLPLVIAIIIQSAIFGGMHFFGVAHAIAAAVMGLILTLVYEWRQTLVTPILVHAGMNSIAALSVAILMIQAANAPVLGVGSDPQDVRCVVRTVLPGSAAEEAEVQVGDVILSVDNKPIRNHAQLRETIRGYRPGDQVTLVIERDGETRKVVATLQRRAELQQK